MKSSLPLTAAALAALALVAGCATPSEPYAQLDGYRWSRVGIDTYDVIIISVDGEHRLQSRGFPMMITPGPHKIVVQAPPTPGNHFGEQRTLELNAEPCTRYWLEARKPTRVTSDFTPAVNYSERIAACKAG